MELRTGSRTELVKLAVTVVTRSPKTEIVGTVGEYLKIRLAAPPVDGEANKALIKYMAKRLGISKSDIRIISGTSSKRKLLDIEGVEQSVVEALLEGKDKKP